MAPGMAPSAEGQAGGRAATLIVAVTAMLLAASQAAQGAKAPEGPLSEIRIEGLVSVPEEKVRREIQSRVGRPWSRDVIEADLKRLSKMQWFSEIKPYLDRDPKGEGVILTFLVREMPVIREVEFRGRKKVRLKDIETTTGLKVGGRADPMRAQMAVAQIKNLYEEKGYGDAEVQLLEGGKLGDTKIVFEIYEGPWVKLGGIDFVGNTIVSDALLRTKISSKTPIITFGGSYRRDDVDADARKLIDYYNGLGYLEAKVAPYTESGDTVGDRRLTFVISEGIQYKVRNIEFHGNEKLSADEIKKMMVLHSGQPYNDSVREADVKKLHQKYSSMGCIDIQVRDERKYTDQPGVIDIAYDIREGDLYRVGEITVSGNQRTRDKVIRRELLMAGLVPGQPLDGTRLETAKKRLMSLGYFQANPEQGKPLELKIVHRRPGDQPYAARGRPQLRRDPADPVPERRGGPRRPARRAAGHAAPRHPPRRRRPRAATASPPSAPAAPGRSTRRPGSSPRSTPRRCRPRPRGSSRPPDPAPGPVRGRINQPIGQWRAPGDLPQLPREQRQRRRPRPAGGVPRSRSDGRRHQRRVRQALLRRHPGRRRGGLHRQLLAGRQRVELPGAQRQPHHPREELRHHQIPHLLQPAHFRTGLPRGRSGPPDRALPRHAHQPGHGHLPRAVPVQPPDRPEHLGLCLHPHLPGLQRASRRDAVLPGRQFGAQTYADVAMRVEDVNINGFQTPAPADFLAASGHSLLASLRPSLRFDNRNDPMAPNKGQYVELAFEQAWGTFTYPKVTLEGKQYFLTGSRPDGSGKRIVTLRGTYGVTGRDTPVYERFYAGDFGSMRGFAFRGVGPHVLGVNVGGVMRAIGSVEYQFPLVASDKLQQVIFCDFGTVQSDYSFTSNQFRAPSAPASASRSPPSAPCPWPSTSPSRSPRSRGTRRATSPSSSAPSGEPRASRRFARMALIPEGFTHGFEISKWRFQIPRFVPRPPQISSRLCTSNGRSFARPRGTPAR